MLPAAPLDANVRCVHASQAQLESKQQSGRVLAALSPNHHIVTFKWAHGHKTHDFVLLQTKQVFADGTCMLAGRSIQCAQVLPQPDCLRSEMRALGWIMRPTPSGGSRVTHVMALDLNAERLVADDILGFSDLMATRMHKFKTFVDDHGAAVALSLASQDASSASLGDHSSFHAASNPPPNGADPLAMWLASSAVRTLRGSQLLTPTGAEPALTTRSSARGSPVVATPARELRGGTVPTSAVRASRDGSERPAGGGLNNSQVKYRFIII